MSSIFAYQNRLHVKTGQAVTFTSAEAASTPPLTNLGEAQLPIVASISGDGSIEAQANDGASPVAAENFTADVFGLLGIENLDAGATIEFFDADSSPATSLGSVTWTPVSGQRHAILTLDTPITINTLKVTLTNAGSGETLIGGIFAGPSVRSSIRPGYGVSTEDTGIVSRSQGGTAWSFGGETVHVWPAEFRCRNQAKLFEFYDALRTCKTTEPVLWIPRDDSGWIERLAVYGYVEDGWRTQNVDQDIHDVIFTVRESL